ncbi:MAG: hypothetical protein LBU19_06010 [Treponema sp.]|jgi:hypothetical protein|nr:hypothetical protein [Treponema sp.]
MAKGRQILPQATPFLTLLPLAPKVFAKQKRFSATPTCFLPAVESLNVDSAMQTPKAVQQPEINTRTGFTVFDFIEFSITPPQNRICRANPKTEFFGLALSSEPVLKTGNIRVVQKPQFLNKSA